MSSVSVNLKDQITISDMLKDTATVEEMLEETMDEYDEYASQDQHVLCFLSLWEMPASWYSKKNIAGYWIEDIATSGSSDLGVKR